MDYTDAPNICAEINQKSIDYALKNAPDATKSRFDKSGIPMRVGTDIGPYNAGPLWIWTSMKYNNKTDA